MFKVMQIELYKLRKRNLLYGLFLCNLLPVFYGLALHFNWSFVKVSVKMDILNFVNIIWILTFILGIPFIIFMYLGASLVGTERQNGQILLEATRVANRSKLILGKFLAVITIVLSFFFVNICMSVLSYFVFVNSTNYAQSVVFDKTSISNIITSVGALFFIILLSFIAILSSIKYSALISTVIGLLFYSISYVLVYIPSVKRFSPGYFALTDQINLKGLLPIIIYQIILYAFLYLIIIQLTKKHFNKIDL